MNKKQITKVRPGAYEIEVDGVLWECTRRDYCENGFTGWWQITENGSPCDLVPTLREFRYLVEALQDGRSEVR